MEVSEKTVKFSAAQIEVLQDFEIGDEVELKLKGTLVKMEYFDQQDGTAKLKYVVRPKEIKDIFILNYRMDEKDVI